MSMPPPEIVVKGGQDLDGAWGTSKTFVREFYYELINVPLPLFMISPFIPAYNSLHPLYPFAIAKDSKISRNIETPVGRAITVSTTYQILKPNVSLNGLSDFDLDAVIRNNLPFLLPAQDVSFEPVQVEEAIDYLYQLSCHRYGHRCRFVHLLTPNSREQVHGTFRKCHFGILLILLGLMKPSLKLPSQVQ